MNFLYNLSVYIILVKLHFEGVTFRKIKSYLDDDSKIIDINFAKEQSNFLRLQILKQSAKAVLS